MAMPSVNTFVAITRPSPRTMNLCTLFEIPLKSVAVDAADVDSKRAAVPFGEFTRARSPNVLPETEVAFAKIAVPALLAFWPSIAVDAPVAESARPANAFPAELLVT